MRTDDRLVMQSVELIRAGQPARAASILRDVVLRSASNVEAHVNLALALEGCGDVDGAAAANRRALEIDGTRAEALYNLGALLWRTGDPEQAAAVLRRAVASDPRQQVLRAMAKVLYDLGRPEESFRYASEAVRRGGGGPAASDALWAAMHFEERGGLLREMHARWGAMFGRYPAPPPFPAYDPGRPLRVGYLSPNFRAHPEARYLEPILRGHSAAVELYLYSDTTRPDDVTERLKGLAGQWRDLCGLDDAAAAALVRGDGIDVLIDPVGHMGRQRLAVFARRAAPVQVTIAYPHWNGIPGMFRLTDAVADPGDTADERLVRVPGCAWVTQPRADAPDVAPLPRDRSGFTTFGAPHKAAKVTGAVARLWGEILRRVPTARLEAAAVGGERNASVRRRLEAAGIPGERLTLVPQRAEADYLAWLTERVDVALDVSPFCGMTTTMDALWMGVPVVTLRGGTTAARVGASILEAVGEPGLVAEDAGGYVTAAVELAGDPGRLRHLRGGLRERVRGGPLADGGRVARAIEHAFTSLLSSSSSAA